MEYRSDIDGLRAVAVLSVLLFHAEIGLTGGFVGVDVFFVISGFLITSLILKKTDTDSFSLKDFWIRRVRRIVPAVVVMIVAVLAVSALFMLPRDLEKLGKSAAVQPIAGANFYFWKDTGYFDGHASLKPLLHTWSLAVEEQFYLLLPLLLVALRKVSRRRLVGILSGVAVCSLGYSIFATDQTPSSAFFLLPSRAWELLAGSLLACAGTRQPFSAGLREIGSWTGLLLILGACFFYSDQTPFPGLAALPPVLGTVFIIQSNVGGQTSLGRLLSCRPCVAIGLISYSLYLWHWPLFALTKYCLASIPSAVTPVLLAFSFMLAVLSYRFVETPFRKNAFNLSGRATFQWAVGAQALILLIGGGFDLLNGLPDRVSVALQQLDQRNRWASSSNDEVAQGKLKLLGIDQDRRAADFLLWGDSHGRAMASFFHGLAESNNLKGYAAIGSNWDAKVIARPDELEIQTRNDRIESLITDRQLKHVFFVQCWEATFAYLSPDWDEYAVYSDAEKQQMTASFGAMLERLCDQGCEIYLLCQPPRQPGGHDFRQRLYSQLAFGTGTDAPSTTLHDYEQNAFWLPPLQAMAQHDQIHLLDIRDTWFDRDGQSHVILDGLSCYRDEDHISNHGAEKLMTPVFAPIFRQLSAKSAEPRIAARTPNVTR